MGDSFAMLRLSRSATMRSDSGCMWRPFTATVLSELHPASATAAAIAIEAKSKRNTG
jgi:hypothetical protein